MSNLINSIVDKDFITADSILEETVELIMARKLEEAKKATAAKMCEQGLNKPSWALQQRGLVEDEIEESGDMGPARTKKEKVMTYKHKNSGKEIDAVKHPGDEWELVKEEAGEESSMARSELASITKDAKTIMSKIKGDKELEAWTQSKITKAADYLNSVADYMDNDEEEQLDEARIKIIKARIRGGKIQRRKKVSNVAGMTLRGGKLQRMSPAERRRRRMGARRAKIKRRSKMNRALMKRQRSLRKRKALGL
jgi:hypothetical protein